MSEQEAVRELELKLAELSDDSVPINYRRIDTLNDLAWALADTDMKRAQELAEEAFELAGSTDDGIPIYELGKAYSLRTLGYLNMRTGDYVSGLEQSFEAQITFETLKQGDGLCDVLDHIGSIFLEIGEFPDSLEYFYMQLDCAQRLRDQRRIANAYNNLAANYYMTGDFERAKETFHKNLQLAREIDSTRHICITELNLAEVCLSIGEPDEALEHALCGLRLSKRAGFESFEVYGLEFLGKAYLAQDSLKKALCTMTEALSFSREMESQRMEMQALKNLGMVYRDMGQFENALSHAEEALKLAHSIGAHHELAESALLLAELHEQQGDFEQALIHFKQHHEINERLSGEKATQRLQVLQVTHDTEVARKEAETLQIKTIQLEREVSERKKAEKALEDARDNLEKRINARTAELRDTVLQLQHEIRERKQAEAEIQQMVETLEQRVADRSQELASLYDMTLLYTEAQELTDILEPALRHICRSVSGDAIAVHVVTADEQRLQLVAQDSISGWEENQQMQLSPEFMNWLKEAEAPIMLVSGEPEHSFLPAQILRPGYATYIGLPLHLHSDVIGLLGMYREQPRPFNVNAVSLLIMMAEQLSIIVQNHRLQDRARQLTRSLERQRLSREMHDSIAQHIYSLHLFARAGRDALADSDLAQANRHLQQLDKNALITLREMRLLLYQLRPSALENQTLAGAIEERFAHVERRLGIEAVIESTEMPPFAEAVEEELYYMITEALNNALKHAEASRVKVYFETRDGRIMIKVHDNGKGFDISQPSSGLGLQNLCERADHIEGLVELETEPGHGTTIRITLPPA